MARKFMLVLVMFCIAVSSFSALRVAVVTNDAIGDRGFTDMAYFGIRKAGEDFDIQWRVFECMNDPSRYYDTLMAAAANFDIIFVNPGYFFDNELSEIMTMYPDKTYVYIDGVTGIEDVISLPFKQNEGAFLAGALAALLTDATALEMIGNQRTVGFVGGQDMPVIRDYQKGFEEGVSYIDPEIRIVARYAGTHFDPARGKETAYQVNREGADVIFQAAGPTGLGVLEAAKDYKFYAIGVDTDQGYIQPGFIVSSMLKRVDVAVWDVVRMAVEGELEKGEVYSYDVANGGIGLAYNDYAMSIIPAGVYLRLKEIEEKIAAGDIVVGSYLE